MADKLTTILQEMIDQAEAGQTVEKPLPGGLHIHLRKDGGVYVLTIYRERVPPSAQEWNVICVFWPYSLGAPNWSNDGVTDSGKYFKQARVPVREM